MRSLGLNATQLVHYGKNLCSALRVAGLVLLAILLLGIFTPAFAQTEPSVTFGASVTNAAGSLSTRLTWSTTPAANSCTASGHPSWTGTKAASGAVDLPPITLSGTYSLTLNCTFAGDSTATLTWVAPTQNTDGSALAKCAVPVPSSGSCLAGYRFYRRLNNPDLSTNAEVTPALDNPNATTRAFTGLVAGTHYFAMEAVNADGVPSVLSNTASKVITGSSTKSAGVTLTVNPKPNTTTLTVQ